MADDILVPPATLASATPYAPPPGGRLVFSYRGYMTDGWPRGDVSIVFANGREPHLLVRNIPAMGGTRTAKIVGDWSKLFPDPLPVVAAPEPV